MAFLRICRVIFVCVGSVLLVGVGCDPVEHSSSRSVPSSAQLRSAALGAPDDRPSLAVVPFRVLGEVRQRDPGESIAEALQPHLSHRYELVDQMQLEQYLVQDDLTRTGLIELAESGPQAPSFGRAVRLKAVRYLVVGTVTGLPDGSFRVSGRINEWQTGTVLRIEEIKADGWSAVLDRMDVLAAKLLGETPPDDEQAGSPSAQAAGPTNALKLTQPLDAVISIAGRTYTILRQGRVVSVPVGKHPFHIRLKGGQTVYGLLTVHVVNEDTRSTTFGAQRGREVFQEHHITAALQGRPVAFDFNILTNRGTIRVMSYRMGLRPFR